MFFSVFAVALLAEGVDRNDDNGYVNIVVIPSPSSRRAWIEISTARGLSSPRPVALLAEGVDRNLKALASSSVLKVALLAEGVDRNMVEESGFPL